MGRATRESDERTLLWIVLRRNGISIAQIAKRHGVSPNLVYRATDDVLKHDVDHCGEGVRAAYR